MKNNFAIFLLLLLSSCRDISGRYVLNGVNNDSIIIYSDYSFERKIVTNTLFTRKGKWTTMKGSIYFHGWGDSANEDIIQGMEIDKGFFDMHVYLHSDFDKDLYYIKVNNNNFSKINQKLR